MPLFILLGGGDMPNCCNSDYTFKGNKDEIKEFHEN